MSPVPEDVRLPCGWTCKRAGEDELVLGYAEGNVEVEAARTDESQLLPFDLTHGWELTCRIRSGESMSERVIGRVTTRTAATEGLRSCMNRVRSLARTTGSMGNFTPARIAQDIDLRGEIPMASQPTGQQ
jgi:hypothetical protein